MINTDADPADPMETTNWETDWQYMKDIEPRSYNCQYLDHDMAIDGNIQKPEWQIVPFSEEFVDIEGACKPRPLWPTRMKMRWSEEYWYFAAEITEPQVWAKLTEKNTVIFQDNDFEIFIDPSSSNSNYYELEINALNTIWELNLPLPYKDGGSPINPYNLRGLKSAVQIQGKVNDPSSEDQGWTVELAIPWSSLRPFHQQDKAVPQLGDYWRVNFSRVEWDVDVQNGQIRKLPGHPEHNWVWSPQGVVDMHRPEKWGFVYFVATGQETPMPRHPIEQLKNHAMELYYLQGKLKQIRGRYSSKEEILHWLSPASAELLQDITLLRGGRAGQSGFLAHFAQTEKKWQLAISHRSQVFF